MSGGNNERTELAILREDVTEVKSDVKGLDTKITDIRLFLAGLEANFVTKTEFERHREAEEKKIQEYQQTNDKKLEKHLERGKTDRRWWAAYIITILNALILLINNFQNWFGSTPAPK